MNGRAFDRRRGRLALHLDWLMLLASVATIGWILLPR